MTPSRNDENTRVRRMLLDWFCPARETRGGSSLPSHPAKRPRRHGE